MIDRQTIFSYLQSGFTVKETANMTGAHLDFVRDCQLTIDEIEQAEPTEQPDWGEDSAFYANQP